MRNKSVIVFSLILLVVLSSGCGLFRKKNRCTTCPTWSYVPADVEESKS